MRGSDGGCFDGHVIPEPVMGMLINILGQDRWMGWLTTTMVRKVVAQVYPE